MQDAFYEVGYDASAFDSIPVPSVWQNHGYDHHQYTNIRYPFPADPPYVPKENPCGAYLCDFTYQKDATAPRAFLNFEGVASCFYVWLNGQFVGYSQVAHSTSEFDVTKFLQDGTNHLAVLVLKWCDGSYMEDQDMFRMNGIFRDVYLLHRPEQCIEDYFITTDIHGSTAGVAVRLRYYDSAVATRITLYDAAGTMVGSVTPVEAPDDAAFPYHAEITIIDPTLWNAEQPYLYKAEIEKDEKYGLVEAAKLLVSNKYYLMICVTYILQQIYGAMISMGTYYTAHILGDKNLFGVFSWAINIPLIIALVFTPTLVAKMHGMYKLNVGSYALATVARALVAVAGYTGSGDVKMMLLFTAIAALGQSPWQGPW